MSGFRAEVPWGNENSAGSHSSKLAPIAGVLPHVYSAQPQNNIGGSQGLAYGYSSSSYQGGNNMRSGPLTYESTVPYFYTGHDSVGPTTPGCGHVQSRGSSHVPVNCVSNFSPVPVNTNPPMPIQSDSRYPVGEDMQINLWQTSVQCKIDSNTKASGPKKCTGPLDHKNKAFLDVLDSSSIFDNSRFTRVMRQIGVEQVDVDKHADTNRNDPKFLYEKQPVDGNCGDVDGLEGAGPAPRPRKATVSKAKSNSKDSTESDKYKTKRCRSYKRLESHAPKSLTCALLGEDGMKIMESPVLLKALGYKGIMKESRSFNTGLETDNNFITEREVSVKDATDGILNPKAASSTESKTKSTASSTSGKTSNSKFTGSSVSYGESLPEIPDPSVQNKKDVSVSKSKKLSNSKKWNTLGDGILKLTNQTTSLPNLRRMTSDVTQNAKAESDCPHNFRLNAGSSSASTPSKRAQSCKPRTSQPSTKQIKPVLFIGKRNKVEDDFVSPYSETSRRNQYWPTKKNMTFSKDEMRRISNENIILEQKMRRLQNRPVSKEFFNDRVRPHVASSTLNREKELKKISNENKVINERIQGIKGGQRHGNFTFKKS